MSYSEEGLGVGFPVNSHRSVAQNLSEMTYVWLFVSGSRGWWRRDLQL